jgi:hypothetical protein
MKPSLTLERLGKGFSRKWPVRLTALSAEVRISGHVEQSVPQGLKPSSGSLFDTAEAVPFVKSLFPICLKPSPNPIPCGTAKAEAVPSVHQHMRKLVAVYTTSHNRGDLILCGQPLFKAINSVLKSNRSHFVLWLHAV